MPTISWISGARLLAAACLFVCLDSYAQTSTPLLDTVHTVAAPTTGVPVEESVAITSTGTYQITLTDLGAALTPAAPLASVALAISSGSSLVNLTAVGTATIANKTKLTGAGSATFNAVAGSTYIIHVTGAPSRNPDGTPVAFSGQFTLTVTPSGSSSQTAFFADALVIPPSSASNSVGIINDTFSVQSSGNYQVTLTDMAMPVALKTLQLFITTPNGTLITPATFSTSPTSPIATATVALQAGMTYEIFAGGQADTANAGLFGANVSPAGGGTPLYQNTVPVGGVVLLGKPALSASSYSVSLTDLTYPAALPQLGVAVTLNGQSVAQLAATGTSNPFTATATTYQVFAAGIASGSQGSYAVSVQPLGGAPVLSVARAVTDSTTGVFVYSYDTTTVGSETINFDLGDFGYPAALTSLKGVAVQNGSLLGTVDSSGTTSATKAINPVSGPVTLLVFAQPGTPSGSSTAAGLFGLDLTASGAGAAEFESSQGVGQLFSAQKVNFSSGGNYQVVVNDLGFPANFATLAVVVTRGTSKIGSIFGGGTLPFIPTTGDYLINFVAQPTTTDQAGTYSIVVQQAPAAATATLQAKPTSVATGGTTMLEWSSTNTSSCTGTSSPAGLWPGSVTTAGSVTSAALTATTTFTFTCVGTDGTSPTQSVTINVTSNTKSGGGGGAISGDVIAILLGLVLLRGLPRRLYRC